MYIPILLYSEGIVRPVAVICGTVVRMLAVCSLTMHSLICEHYDNAFMHSTY